MPAAATSSTSTIAPGAHVEIRDAVWRVLQVDRTSTGGYSYRVVGISEIVRDHEAIFLSELERSVRVLDPATIALVEDRSPGHRDTLLYMESLLRDVPPTSSALHIGDRAVMDALDYQLEPAALALSRLRQRILIADAVGLGKTLEAGILLSELMLRGRAKRVLVATTKSMLTQFQKEMWSRFSIPLVRLDSQGLTRIRQYIPTNHNPFYHFDKVIISIDTLKQNNAFRTHVERAWWDVIVIDEAHNVATRGGGRSQRAKIAEVLAERCDAMILLSATPHDGKARSFASLMNMLDPTAIANPDSYTKADIDGLFVRRFKKDVADQLAKAIPERKMLKATVDASALEETVYAKLVALEFRYFKGLRDSGILFKTSLIKAIFSSPQACLPVLTAPLRRKQVRELLPADFFPRKRNDEDDGKKNNKKDKNKHSKLLRQAHKHILENCRERLGDRFDDLLGDLDNLADLAESLEAIGPADFSKYRELLRVINKTFKWKPSKKTDRLVIFSERIETLVFLRTQLAKDFRLKPEQIKILHGGLSDTEQNTIVESFGKEKSKLRILLASDVASEGLNLHYLCHRLFHFDIPWSLMVFAQRNGRIDRYGQEKQPYIVYLQTKSKESDKNKDKLIGDMHILDLLIKRDEQATKNIGDPSAFTRCFSIEDEEAQTAQAIESGSAEELGALYDSNLALADGFDLFAELEKKPSAGPSTVPKQRLSLFASEHDFARVSLERLKNPASARNPAAREGLRCSFEDEVIKIAMPPDNRTSRREKKPGLDLRKRFRKLPVEILPSDGVVMLSANKQRVMEAIELARREEHVWPNIQYLWPLNPVVKWLCDKGRAIFGRHTAPVMTLRKGLPANEVVVVISGLIPNRRSQPLVHRWYCVRFVGRKFEAIEDFGDFCKRVKFVFGNYQNREQPDQVALASLRELIPEAVAQAHQVIVARQQKFAEEIEVRRQAEVAKLEQLKQRQLDELKKLFDSRPMTHLLYEQKIRRIKRIFANYTTWAKDTLTSEPNPFLQVIAVLRPESGGAA